MPSALRLAVTVLACGVACRGPEPPRPPLVKRDVAGGPLRLDCEASRIQYPGNPFPSGCERRLTLRWKDGTVVVGSSDFGAACREVRAKCDATTGEVAVRPDGASHRIAVSYRGPTSGFAALYLVPPSGRWLLVERGDGGRGAEEVLGAMPELHVAIDQALGRELGTHDGSREDALWDLLADPVAAKRHAGRLAELARLCRLPEPVARALVAADPAAVPAMYAGALIPTCNAARVALADADGAAVRDLIAADLAAREGPTGPADVALAGLVSERGLRDLAASLAARLVLPPPPIPGVPDESLAAWTRLAGILDEFTPEATTTARLEALAWAPGAPYTHCEIPGPHWAATYTGDPPSFAIAVASGLLDRDTPAVREALVTIGADPARSGAARQMARFLLTRWKDPRAGRLADVAPDPCGTPPAAPVAGG